MEMMRVQEGGGKIQRCGIIVSLRGDDVRSHCDDDLSLENNGFRIIFRFSVKKYIHIWLLDSLNILSSIPLILYSFVHSSHLLKHMVICGYAVLINKDTKLINIII